jgi:hypothetical protein
VTLITPADEQQQESMIDIIYSRTGIIFLLLGIFRWLIVISPQQRANATLE